MKSVKKYLLGWIVGPAAAIYGLAALIAGRTYLPGLHGDRATMDGPGGTALAFAYLAGGIFLFTRLVVEKQEKYRKWEKLIYAIENFLLIAFLASVMYFLVVPVATQ